MNACWVKINSQLITENSVGQSNKVKKIKNQDQEIQNEFCLIKFICGDLIDFHKKRILSLISFFLYLFSDLPSLWLILCLLPAFLVYLIYFD